MSEKPICQCATGAPLFSNMVLAYCVTAILSSVLVIVKETTPAVEKLLVALTGHHWTAHCALIVFTFVVLTIIFKALGLANRLGLGINCLLRYLVVSTVVGTVMILSFYLLYS